MGIRLLIIIIFANLLFGCATVSHIPLQRQDRESVKSIYVNPHISKPNEIDMITRNDQVAGILLGPVGVMASVGSEKSQKELLQKRLQKLNIDISEIVYNQWRKQLQGNHKFKVATLPSDAELKVEVKMYGFTSLNGFSSDYAPTLLINAKLIKNNKVIWQDGEFAYSFDSRLPRFKFDQVQENPKLLGQVWDKAASQLIGKMIADM